MTPNSRFVPVVMLLAACAVFLQVRPGHEGSPPRQPLASLPLVLGTWQGFEEPISPAVLPTLGDGDFLRRVYQSTSSAGPIELFIAYFPSQREGDTIHSPQNCLPGSGWSPLASTRIVLNLSGQGPFQVNRYLIGKGGERQVVLYWYLSHGRAEASEYWAKFYLVTDSIRSNRSDGALIRMSTGLSENESVETAQARLIDLAGKLVSVINTYIPR